MLPITRAAAQMTVPVALAVPIVDTARTTTGVDVTAYEGVAVVTAITGAAAGSGVMTISLQSSPDNSAWAVVPEFGGLGTGITANTSGSNQVFSYAVDLDGPNRRFLRVVTVLVSGTSLATAVTLHAVRKYGG